MLFQGVKSCNAVAVMNLGMLSFVGLQNWCSEFQFHILHQNKNCSESCNKMCEKCFFSTTNLWHNLDLSWEVNRYFDRSFYPLTQFLLCFYTNPELLETFFVCKSKSNPDPTFERWGIQFKIWGIFHISIWISHIINHFIYWIHLNRLKYIYAHSATHLNTNIFLLHHRHQQ